MTGNQRHTLTAIFLHYLNIAPKTPAATNVTMIYAEKAHPIFFLNTCQLLSLQKSRGATIILPLIAYAIKNDIIPIIPPIP